MNLPELPFLLVSRGKLEERVARQTLEACEHIIAEMGAELHDDLIQKLAVFTLYMDRLERSAGDRQETEHLVVKMRAEFQEVIRSIRSTSRRLMAPVTDDASFTNNLALLCQNLERPGVGNIHFTSSGTEQQLSPIAHRYLARIVQELVHNAYRHSSAWHIIITLTWSPDVLTLTVEDDGSALNRVNEFIDTLRKKNNTLRLRAQALNATLRYVPGPKGLIAEVKYPL